MGSPRKQREPQNIHPRLVKHFWERSLNQIGLTPESPKHVENPQQNRYFQWARVRVFCLLHYYFSDRTFDHIATCVGSGMRAVDVRRTLDKCCEDFRIRDWPFYQLQRNAFLLCLDREGYKYWAKGLSFGYLGEPAEDEPGPIRIVRRLEEIDEVMFCEQSGPQHAEA